MLCKKDLKLTELQLYINNIAGFLVIVFLLSLNRQYHQFNTLIKYSTFLKVDFLQITTAFDKPLIFTKIPEHYPNPNQYLFLAVSHSTDFDTTIKYLLAELN